MKKQMPRPNTKRVNKAALDLLQDSVALLTSSLASPATRPSARGKRWRRSTSSDIDALYRRLAGISEAVTIWHTNEQYLDSSGAPLPLPKTGKKSLGSIARKIYKSPRSAGQLVTDLIALPSVKRTRAGYLPAHRSAILATRASFSLGYAAIAVSRLIGTIVHNVQGGKPALFERQLIEVEIDRSDLHLFAKFSEQQAQYLIDAIDDWLERRKAVPNARRKSITVGVGAFAWSK